MRISASSKAALVLGSLAMSALLVDACKEPTQVTLDVRSTNDCSALRGVNIGVAGSPVVAEERVGAYLSAEAPKCKPGALDIGTLVVTPGESGRAAVIVVAGVSSEAKACTKPDYKGCVVARRSLSFVQGSSLVVPILIDFKCEDVPCSVDTTCKNGECIGSELECTEEGCITKDPRGRDDDAGTTDGGPDANVNDGSNPSDVIVPPNDGSQPSDATTTNDGALPPSCHHLCPSGGTCNSGEACCYGQNRAPTCKSVAACHNPATTPPGVSACCANTQDCSLGTPGLSFCCAEWKSKSPFTAVATCFSVPCSGSNVVQLCLTDGECGAQRKCKSCQDLGYTGSSLNCCEP